MNKYLRTLTAVFAFLAVAGCGKQEAADEAPAASAPNLSETATGEASDNLVQEENDVAPALGQENGDLALWTAQGADDSKATNNEAAFEAENSSFSLDGKRVTLKNGLSEVAAAPGSASLATTRYLGKEARGDLTRDGEEDVAYLVTHDGGGSGQFYYAVVAINGKNGHKTTNAFLVGERINPQSLRITSNELQVKFVGREKGEPMSAPPSVESVLLLKVTPRGVLEGLMK